MNNIDDSKYQGIKGYMKYLESIGEKIDPLKISQKLGKSIDDVLEAGKELGKQFAKTYCYVDGIYSETHYCEIKEWSPEKDPSTQANISIGFLHPMYISINDLQEKDYEYRKIEKFLKKYINGYCEQKGINSEEIKIEFINYGKTELVYVLTEPNGTRVTLLVKQPAVELGKVKQEAIYLTELQKRDPMVVAPIDYYRYGDYELYATPYINQARCIASDGTWGMYVPEPFYFFYSFNQEQKSIVTRCMISKLVSLYDFDRTEGIGECKLGGGDFMLPKGWELEIPTIENTLSNLYLIAARDKINCSFEEYLNILRDEFSRRTIQEDQDEIRINKRGRVAMDVEDIEAGIELGIKNSKKQLAHRLVKTLSKKL